MKFLNTVGFLTRIKIPQKKILKIEISKFYELLNYFPLVGLFTGILSFLVFFLLHLVFPIIFCAFAVVVFEILITGAFHLDGLADTFDGYFSKVKESQKIIEIMKRPNIGVFGVLSLILFIIIKFILIYILANLIFINPVFRVISRQSTQVIGFLNIINIRYFLISIPAYLKFFNILFFMNIFSKLSMLYLFAKYEPAVKENSLAVLFKHSSNRKVFISQTIMYVLIFIFLNTLIDLYYKYFYILNTSLNLKNFNSLFGYNIMPIILKNLIYFCIDNIFIILIISILVAVTAKIFTKKINGITGDIIGCVSSLTEVYFLFFIYMGFILNNYITNFVQHY